MHCHAGCDTRNILSAIGLTEKDLFNNEKQQKPELVKEYSFLFISFPSNKSFKFLLKEKT